MKLASVALQSGQVLGAVVSGEGYAVLPDGLGVADLIAAGLDRALEIGGRAGGIRPWGTDDARLALPYRPTSVRDFVTFESHVEGVRKSIDNAVGVPEAWYDGPTFYFTNPHALYGPGEAIRRPRTCRRLDFELEVGAIVSGGGADLSDEAAHAAIFGYTIVNDWSARDIQSREMQVGLGPAKGKDFATSIGPWIVTADEVADRHDARGRLDLTATVSVNGVEVGRDTLAHMNWSFAHMVAYASRDSVVLTGDLLASGTTGGGGCLAELWGRRGTDDPAPLEPGDVVTMRVEGLGELTGLVATA
ncbi:MAG: fumarylacetoacetate hydrolase family protein [Phycicoccus sp.]|nr:fumarylacetoacetate hydrolase family protein [Phycicoccus sp.]